MEKAQTGLSTQPSLCSHFINVITKLPRYLKNRTIKFILLALVLFVLLSNLDLPFISNDTFPLGFSSRADKAEGALDLEIGSSTGMKDIFPKGILQSTQKDPTVLSIDVRRRLAATVAEVYQEVVRLAGYHSFIDAKLALKLASVAEELDPRISVSLQSQKEYSATLVNVTKVKPLPSKSRHVCPEVYNRTFDPFGQIGMQSEDCDYVPNFNKVLTVILPATSWTAERVNSVVKQIRSYYKIPIVSLVLSKDNIDTSVPNLRIEMTKEGVSESLAMNQLFKSIETPFVLIGTSLANFNNQSSLERLVRILDELEHVKVVGGAARDRRGLWMHGCLQQRMAVYEAHYALGYYYSKYECMYCDDLLTPFVTTVALLKKIPFQKDLSGHVMYRDWFAKLRVKGILSMACPDVMFYVLSHPKMNEKQWLLMAKQWTLEKITSFDNRVYVFECSSVGITCSAPLRTVASFQLAPCCRAQMDKYLLYLLKYGKKKNLDYELHAGSIMGALKMNRYLAWDYDHDISFLCKDFKAWKETNPVLEKIHCKTLVIANNKYLTVNCPNFFIELYCHKYNASTHQYLPAEYKDVPTVIRYAGRNIAVRANPGLYARNKYGFEWLKHESHWRTVENGLGSYMKAQYNPVHWRSCKDPKHHSCLDHYPIDGNLPFQKPFLRLS
ncbi:uncharacterized protein [Palaemon carinicauda]|uniref:uncharacterized protein n=1 Tax=Palaemon carinicauda TaxID=392227 RepID=UPI0035B58805